MERLARIAALAKDAFGSPDDARDFLHAPHPELGGDRPLNRADGARSEASRRTIVAHGIRATGLSRGTTTRHSPLSVYRVARAIHPLFDGRGAARFGARWTSPGRLAIYLAGSYAGALLRSWRTLAGSTSRLNTVVSLSIFPRGSRSSKSARGACEDGMQLTMLRAELSVIAGWMKGKARYSVYRL